ncbi:hypothetical protein KPL70_011045 [Citrus sinensis]|nr:uncharacterized protein LOC102625559 isoform X4 [Citrus sinensis]XP_024042373.1 uncharacterized protein LOC18044578 [Citrus x clementina]KAH9703222.1 hypothetical protein KPL70_011045 [Citrus sinensis]KDO67757.1 hypothetical protein CISIN_1g026444mg [Citrus sinensis]
METVTATSNNETKKVKLKLIIDKPANKVQFAEAEKDFVDILFNLLYMPFGSVIRLLRDAGMVGCTGNLYQSLENLSEALLIPNQTNVELLKPLLKWEKESLLLLQACPQPVERKLYGCPYYHSYVTNQMDTRCPQCSNYLNNALPQVNMVPGSEGGIVKKSVAFTVTDDLSVTPGSMISGIGLLQGKLKDAIGALEERVVDIGPDEVLELFNASFQTNEALSTVFLPHEERVHGMKII